MESVNWSYGPTSCGFGMMRRRRVDEVFTGFCWEYFFIAFINEWCAYQYFRWYVGDDSETKLENRVTKADIQFYYFVDAKRWLVKLPSMM